MRYCQGGHDKKAHRPHLDHVHGDGCAAHLAERIAHARTPEQVLQLILRNALHPLAKLWRGLQHGSQLQEEPALHRGDARGRRRSPQKPAQSLHAPGGHCQAHRNEDLSRLHAFTVAAVVEDASCVYEEVLVRIEVEPRSHSSEPSAEQSGGCDLVEVGNEDHLRQWGQRGARNPPQSHQHIDLDDFVLGEDGGLLEQRGPKIIKRG
mmetsp:Transcript_85182/g.178016  ORF Transcript_85182/g.178016 Transcript_85182/m.178016 type:complete len:207 (-) Transcript_85182:398-1018(-)